MNELTENSNTVLKINFAIYEKISKKSQYIRIKFISVIVAYNILILFKKMRQNDYFCN